MATETLMEKCRAQSFDEIRGVYNLGIKQSILAGLGRLHFYLLWGDPGCGKTTIARLIAKELSDSNPAKSDIKEINAGISNSIDMIRQIREKSFYKTWGGGYRIYIFDECHRLTLPALDGMLKMLEEPPAWEYFIFCTTELDKMPATIKSRAQMFELKPLEYRPAFALMRDVIAREKINISENVFNTIIEDYSGVPRDMLNALDKIRDITDEKIALSLVAKPGVKKLEWIPPEERK